MDEAGADGAAGGGGAGANGAASGASQGTNGAASDASQGTNGAASDASQGGGGAGANGAASDAAWYESFADKDLRNYAAGKQWANPMEAVRSGMNLEKLVKTPEDQLVRLPKPDDVEGWNKVYDKLGRPAKAEEYQLPVPEGDDGEFAKTAAEWMHKAGLTKTQAQALAKLNNEYAAGLRTKAAEAQAAKVAAENATLKTEWGAAYDKNLNIARGAARELGIDGATIDALEKSMGFAGVIRHLHSLGSKIGEDKFVSGSGSPGFNGVMSPAQAQGQLAMLKSDPGFLTKYLNGDAEASAKMAHLHKMAYPDE
jgi:hypothetical protein